MAGLRAGHPAWMAGASPAMERLFPPRSGRNFPPELATVDNGDWAPL